MKDERKRNEGCPKMYVGMVQVEGTHKKQEQGREVRHLSDLKLSEAVLQAIHICI
jgi:hypothetical protein